MIKKVANCSTGSAYIASRLMIMFFLFMSTFSARWLFWWNTHGNSNDWLNIYLVLYLIDSEGKEKIDANYSCLDGEIFEEMYLLIKTPAFFSLYKLFIVVGEDLLLSEYLTNTTKEDCSFKTMATEIANAMQTLSTANCNYKLYVL